jgi:hypothetical protein
MTRPFLPLLAVVLALPTPAPAAGDPEPLVLRPAPRTGEGPPGLRLQGARGARARTWRPDLATANATADLPRITVDSPYGNYHAVVAEREAGGVHTAAIRYVYRHGRPSGHSPRRLLGAVKAPLEIVPAPAPREHHRYRAGDEAPFRVRFQGLPLAGATVTLRTSHGSVQRAETGPAGVVRLRLPDDFPRVRPGRRNNPPAELTLTARHREGDRRYVTRLSAAYHVDPGHWRSLEWALVLAGAGLLTGLGGTWWAFRRDDNHRSRA